MAGRGGPRAAWLGPTDRALAPLETRPPSAPAERRGDCSARPPHRKRASGKASRRLPGAAAPGAAAPGASGFGPGNSGAVPAACGRASALGRSKVQGHAVPGRARARARQRAPEPPACRRANLCAGSGALTMEHGLREADVVIMTAAAARAGSHSPWSLPGPWCAPRCRAAASAAGSSAPRRARCFIHPRVGGTRHGLALSSAFPRTSVGSAAVYFQFLLRAGSAGSSFGFISRRLQRPPPSPAHLRPPLALPVHLDQDQRRTPQRTEGDF